LHGLRGKPLTTFRPAGHIAHAYITLPVGCHYILLSFVLRNAPRG
jgi:hypothetical protein